VLVTGESAILDAKDRLRTGDKLRERLAALLAEAVDIAARSEEKSPNS
jgi:hypothetical protein